MSRINVPRLTRSLLAIAALAAASACVDRRATPADGGTTFGSECSASSDCASEICVLTRPGAGRCSVSCAGDETCPPDWRCADVGGVQACTCDAAPSESCNGRDDDCDVHVDEGTGAEVGCAEGEVCSAGACACPPANVCGGACVDLESDPSHCGTCGNACASGQCASGRCCTEVPRAGGPLDLLLVVDNSGSMTEEQASLARELPSLLEWLTTGDADGDGGRDFPPVTDIHVGVITTDMGTAGFTVPTCGRSDFGDDGILRTQGRVDMTGCSATYPSILRYGGDALSFAEEVICVANMGTGGCGFEQQLEAMLKALSPAAPTAWTADDYAAPVFHEGTSGHGDRANDGFLRDDSTLAVIMISDEEDCSARDGEIFNPSSPTYGATDLNLRCFAHGEEALHPISRFVGGLVSLRRTPGDVVFVPIVGVPVDLAPEPGEPTSFELLVGPNDVRDPRMIEQVDVSMPNRLVPSCNTANGIAFPPVRIVRVAEGLDARGAGVTVQSVCQDSFAGAMRAFVATLTAPRLSCE